MAGVVGVAGLAFLAHTVSVLTGWYDLTPMYEFFNVNSAEFGWTTISAPGAYLVTKIGYDTLKSNTNYKAELDKFNTDRLIDAQMLVKAEQIAANLKMDRQYQAELKTQSMLEQILVLEAEKKAKLAEIEANKQSILDTIDNTEEV